MRLDASPAHGVSEEAPPWTRGWGATRVGRGGAGLRVRTSGVFGFSTNRARNLGVALSAVSRCRRNGRGDRHRIGVPRASIFFALSAGAAESSARLNELPSYSARLDVRTPSACAAEAGSASASSRVLGAQSQVGSCAAAGRHNFERRRLHSIGEATSASLR